MSAEDRIDASTFVALAVSARNVPKMDVLSESDPIARISIFTHNSAPPKWTVIGRTEHFDNQPNPNFRTTITTEYHFERRTQLLVELFDVEDRRNLDDFDKMDFIGHVEFSMSQIMGARRNALEIPLNRDRPPRVPAGDSAVAPLRANEQRGPKQSTILIRAEELKRNTDFVKCQMRCLKLSTPGWFSTTNAAIQVGYKTPNGIFTPLAETPTILSTEAPTFPSIKIPITRLLGIPPNPNDFVVPANLYEPIPPASLAKVPEHTRHLYPNARGRPVAAGNYSAAVTFRVVNYTRPVPDRSYTVTQAHNLLRTEREREEKSAAAKQWKNENEAQAFGVPLIAADAGGQMAEIIGECTVPLYTILTSTITPSILQYAPPDLRKVLETNSTMRRTQILRRPGKKADSLQKNRGTLIIEQFDMWCQPTFLDYVRAGLDFRLMLAIDFTGSNGHYRDRGSLHELKDRVSNPYQTAIQSIGRIVADYTRSAKIPVYGFGAVVSVDGAPRSVSHCFPLTRTSDPMVDGIEGVLQTYRSSLSHLDFSGPTKFADIVRTTTGFTIQPYEAAYQHFTILMIITDGLINDMEDTITSIVNASHYPLSIIIVGVGNENFDSMVALDSDDSILTDQHGRQAMADIVQFVPFNEAIRDGPDELARTTLEEIPGQVMKFMRAHEIYPIHPDDLMARRQSLFERGSSMQPVSADAAASAAAGRFGGDESKMAQP